MANELTEEQKRIKELAVALRTAIEGLIEVTDQTTSTVQAMNKMAAQLKGTQESFSREAGNIVAHVKNQLPNDVAHKLSAVVNVAVDQAVSSSLKQLKDASANAQTAAQTLHRVMTDERRQLIWQAIIGGAVAGSLAGLFTGLLLFLKWPGR
jgi:hypothetical protein